MEATLLAVMNRTDDRATQAASSAPDAATLGRFVLDILLRQADGRVTASPAGYVAARAREQGLDEAQAKTPFGNVLTILETGAETGSEKQIIGAYAAQGLKDLLGSCDDVERSARLRKILGSLDWLSAYGPYDVYAHVEEVCPEPVARAIWEELTRATLEESAREDGRIYRLLRTEVVCRARGPQQKTLCERLARSGDPAVAALAKAELGADFAVRELPEPGAPAISGRLGPRPVGRVRRLAALCTGWTLLRAAASAVGRYLFGLKRPMQISVAARGILCRWRLELLGKTIREGEELVPFAGLAAIEREARYPYLYLLVGVAGLAVGTIWGVLSIFDGIRGAYPLLAIIGLSAVVLGVAFDLGLTRFWPASRGRVSLTLLRAPRRWIRIVDVDGEQAHRFVAAINEQLSRH